MSTSIFNEIKNICLHKKIKIQPLVVKPIQITNISQDLGLTPASEKVNTQLILVKNKLITCYEEDYTRNANEIMKLWHRN